MCGRYVGLTEKEIADIIETVQQVDAEINGPKMALADLDSREVFPGSYAPVVLAEGGKLALRQMFWGFPGYPDRKNPAAKPKLLINAKSETAEMLPTWRDSVALRRCLVPSGGFYEWKRSASPKIKYLFRLPGEKWLWMAAVYKPFAAKDGGIVECFSILTTAANPSVSSVHDRMPVVLRKEELATWLFGSYADVFDRQDVWLESVPVGGGQVQLGLFDDNGQG